MASARLLPYTICLMNKPWSMEGYNTHPLSKYLLSSEYEKSKYTVLDKANGITIHDTTTTSVFYLEK